MPAHSLGADYFDRVYAASDDPWHFTSSTYEAEKYAATLDALGSRRYSSALEIGCSIGVLSEKLAASCGTLLSVDINARALALARERCAELPGVRFEQRAIPADFPGGPFDLVVLSEVGYYWSDADLALARDRIVETSRGGTLVLVHYLPKVADYVRDGDAVHAAFLGDDRFTALGNRRAAFYRIDVLGIR